MVFLLVMMSLLLVMVFLLFLLFMVPIVHPFILLLVGFPAVLVTAVVQAVVRAAGLALPRPLLCLARLRRRLCPPGG